MLCFIFFGGETPVEAQRIGRMGFLTEDANSRDYFIYKMVFPTTSITTSSTAADATVDFGIAGGWTQDTSNKYIYITDGTYLVGLNDATPDGQLDITISTAATIGLDIDGAAAQSANIVDIDDATGDELFTIDKDGVVTISDRLNFLRTGGTGQYIKSHTDTTLHMRKASGDDCILDIGTVDCSLFRNNSSLAADYDNNGSNPSSTFRITQDGVRQFEITGTTGYVGIGDVTPDVQLEVNGVIRSTNSEWYACKYINGFSVDPGSSGATWTAPDSNTLGGYNLDGDNEFLYFNAKICSDWDATSDVIVRVFWEVNDASATGDASFDLSVYMKGDDESSVKTQALTDVVDATGDTRYTQHYSDFVIDYDDGSNPVDSGDLITCKLNYDATNADLSDVIYNYAIILYQTKKVKIEIP